MASPSHLVSVVIPTYNRCTTVRRALDALSRQTLDPDRYEVIVSIDGSDDGTREMVEGYRTAYRLRALWQPNRGRAAACNAGIRAADGELVVMLDDDMEASPAFLEEHLLAHGLTDGGVVGGKGGRLPVTPGPSLPRSEGRFLGVVGAVPIAVNAQSPPVVRFIGEKFNRHLDELARPEHAFRLRDFYSGNFSIRRGVLLEVGGYDESFKVYGNEDLELSLRLTAAGVRLVYSPGALAHQRYTKDFAGLARDNRDKGRTSIILARKHPETLHELRLSAYHDDSPRWRFVRSCLLTLSGLWDGTPGAVVAFTDLLGRLDPPGLDLWYRLVLDYFYWLGVFGTLREGVR